MSAQDAAALGMRSAYAQDGATMMWAVQPAMALPEWSAEAVEGEALLYLPQQKLLPGGENTIQHTSNDVSADLCRLYFSIQQLQWWKHFQDGVRPLGHMLTMFSLVSLIAGKASILDGRTFTSSWASICLRRLYERCVRGRWLICSWWRDDCSANQVLYEIPLGR